MSEVDDEWNKQFNKKEEKREPNTRGQQTLGLIELIYEYCRNNLFLDQFQVPHAAIQVNGHLETLPLHSKRFKEWLGRIIYKEKKSLVDNRTLKEIVDLISAEAKFSDACKTINLNLRVAQSELDSNITWFYDLTNENWEFVEINSDGWKIIRNQIIFRRYNNQSPQVYPSREYEPDIFDKFMMLLLNVNVESEETRREYTLLLKCYIVSLFIPDIPKVVLLPHGHQGSAKTTLMESIKSLVDPSIIKTLSFPRDINELVQQLSHNYVAYYDNVSLLKDWISDQLCRAVSGGGFSKRSLYTDDDDYIYMLRRCIGINGINLAATKADLIDRAITILLKRIENCNRRKDQDIKKQIADMSSQLLGHILDILVKVLKFIKTENIELNDYPRMADFAEYGEIISRCMGYPQNEFLRIYKNNTKVQTEELIESSPVAICVRELIFTKYELSKEWNGTASTLLHDLETLTDILKIDIHGKNWPKSPNSLTRKLNEIIPTLREIGIEIKFAKSQDRKRTRIVTIQNISSESSEISNQKDLRNKSTDDMDGILRFMQQATKAQRENRISNNGNH